MAWKDFALWRIVLHYNIKRSSLIAEDPDQDIDPLTVSLSRHTVRVPPHEFATLLLLGLLLGRLLGLLRELPPALPRRLRICISTDAELACAVRGEEERRERRRRERSVAERRRLSGERGKKGAWGNGGRL